MPLTSTQAPLTSTFERSLAHRWPPSRDRPWGRAGRERRSRSPSPGSQPSAFRTPVPGSVSTRKLSGEFTLKP
eukprot:1185792-Prorocentrum_minimum.AAC.3